MQKFKKAVQAAAAVLALLGGGGVVTDEVIAFPLIVKNIKNKGRKSTKKGGFQMSGFKKAVLTGAIVLGLMVGAKSSYAATNAANAAQLQSELSNPNYDIQLTADINWADLGGTALNVAESGIIRGAAAGGILTVNGYDTTYYTLGFDANNKQLNFLGNLAFSNFDNNGPGGAIYAANSTIINFSGNTTVFIKNTSYAGSALFSLNSLVDFSGQVVNFTSNTALSSVSDGALGGAIAAADGSITFRGNTVNFITNTSEYSGGAIHIENETISFNTQKVNFSKNKAALGGAITVGAVSMSFNSGEANFTNNLSTGSGGAMTIITSTVSFNGQAVNFIDNTGISYGGAINIYRASLKFNNGEVKFANNISTNVGGAIFVEQAEAFFGAQSIDFISNTGQQFGGAIAALNAKITFDGNTTNFTANKSNNGGAMEIEASTIAFNGQAVNFTGNSSQQGGALRIILYSSVTISNAKFQDNTAAYNGGALTISSSALSMIANNRDISFEYNTAGHYGGALCITSASALSIIANNSDILFEHNTAGSDGGALYITSASVLIYAKNKDILFNGNRANHLNNDIYIGEDADIELNAASGKKIVLSGGLSGGDNSADKRSVVKKTGTGDLIFDGAARVYNYAKFNIEGGAVKFKENSGGTIKFGELSISSTALYSTVNGIQDITYIDDTAAIDGNLEIDITNNWADRISAFKIILGADSELNVSFSGKQSRSERKIEILSAFDNISGDFGSVSGINSNYVFKAANNKSIYLLLPANISEKFDAFYANVLKSGARSVGTDALYNKIQFRNESGAKGWVGAYGEGRTLEDFKTSGIGANAGFDFMIGKKVLGGVYFRYGGNSLEENEFSADMSDLEFGIYAGILNIKERFNLKANAGYGMQNFSIKDGFEDFKTNAIKAGADFELVVKGSAFDFKPFAGLRAGQVSNDKIKLDDDIYIQSNDFMRTDFLLGFGMDKQIGALSLKAKLYGGLIASGGQIEYLVTDGTKMKSATEEGIYGAITAGGEYKASQAVSIFVNVGADFGQSAGWMGGAGLGYKF